MIDFVEHFIIYIQHLFLFWIHPWNLLVSLVFCP